MIISYPSESFSIESHIFIMVIATIVITVGLIFGYIITTRIKKKLATPTKWDTILKDIIPASGIILALASPVITTAFNPVLDYSVSEDNTNGSVQAKINNYGFVSAKAIQVYFNLPGKDFSKITSMPIINGTIPMTSDILDSGNGIFYIPALTPGSETIITALVNSTLASNDNVTVYVRSETSTGIHQVVPLTQAYVSYAIIIIFDALFIIWKQWTLDHRSIAFLTTSNLAAASIIFAILFYRVCEGNGNCLSHGISI